MPGFDFSTYSPSLASPLTVTNCTLYDNSAGVTAGGLFNYFGTPIVGNTIIAENKSPSDPGFRGSVLTSNGYNLIGIGNSRGPRGFSNTGDQVGTAASPIDPCSAPLGDYGGPTQTMALLSGSPALDAGSNALAVDANGSSLTTDQRGFARLFNGTVDIGAFEAQPLTVTATSTTLASSANASVYGQSVTFTATVGANTPGSGMPTGTITFYYDTQDAQHQIGQPVPLDRGQAISAALSSLVVGDHPIFAVYSGEGNFITSTSPALQQQVTAKHLTVASITAEDKPYDGTTAATILAFTLDGVVGDDDVGLTGTATFDTRNAGTAKTVTDSNLGLTGAAASNYVLDTTSATATANITALHVIGSFTVQSKTYDGTTTATVLTRSPGAVISGDDVSLTGGTATFDTKNVGTGKTVTLSGASLTGADAGNYVLDAVAPTIADITARTLHVSAAGVNKVYDGTTGATIILSDDRVSGDSFTDSYSSASFSDKNVGPGKTVSVSGISINGTDAANYSLASPTANTTADITALAIDGQHHRRQQGLRRDNDRHHHLPYDSRRGQRR